MTAASVPGRTVFCLNVEAKGKPRPRFTKAGFAYMPKAYEGYEESIADAYRKAGGRLREGPVNVEITYRRRLPASRPKKVTREPDLGKPDVDNVAKAVLDALNGVAYVDDAQVVELRIRKQRRRREEPELFVVVDDVAYIDWGF